MRTVWRMECQLDGQFVFTRNKGIVVNSYSIIEFYYNRKWI